VRVKTNRRDALQFARLLRAGGLTEVWLHWSGQDLHDLQTKHRLVTDERCGHRSGVSGQVVRV
jgi:hypothetical protein